MNGKNPNYRQNALSRFYEAIFAGVGNAWTGHGWMPHNYVKMLGIVFLILSPFWVWFWLILDVWGEIRTLTGDTISRENSDDVRNVAYALGVTITALAGLLAAPLILIRAWVSKRHANTAEQGLITDRFTRAVEQLGAEKTVKRREFKPRYKVDDEDNWLRDENGEPIPATRPDGTALGVSETFGETVPNLEVRLGAIYALERIAQDSERDHIPIMETLCAYIRENAPAKDAKDHGLGDWPDWIDNADDKARAKRDAVLEARSEDLRKWVNALPAPRVDVQAALSVIGRRGEERIAHERNQRRDADDPGFRLDLRSANLQKADLTRARLDHALLTGARMEGANLHSANLKSADLKAWSGARTSLRSADFTEVKHLSQDHVNAAFGDSATILPPGIVMPDHWDDEAIEIYDEDPKYQAWLDAGAPPGKPRTA